MKTLQQARIFVMIPTFNESGNIGSLLDSILALDDNIHIVVVDDHSPDGTWQIVKDYKETNERVHLVDRKDKRGRGSAGIDGFRYAYEQGADYVIEMDGDFSHDPKYIPDFIAASDKADIIIGSRLIPGGGETGRNFMRTAITRVANWLIRTILGFSVRDCTSGYRCYSRDILRKINLERLSENSPAILQEMMLYARRNEGTFLEIPIVFKERKAGNSTFTAKTMVKCLWAVSKLRFRNEKHATNP